eukprot:scaffold12214_cov159-Amphora_coffeaeformis.AAC.14
MDDSVGLSITAVMPPVTLACKAACKARSSSSWSIKQGRKLSMVTIFQYPSRNNRTCTIPSSGTALLPPDVEEIVDGKSRCIKSGRSATTASADRNQQSPTLPCFKSWAENSGVVPSCCCLTNTCPVWLPKRYQ